jgi:hypothetical protein
MDIVKNTELVDGWDTMSQDNRAEILNELEIVVFNQYNVKLANL